MTSSNYPQSVQNQYYSEAIVDYSQQSNLGKIIFINKLKY